MKKSVFSESVLSLLLLSACANQTLVPPLPEKAYITIAEDATHQLTSLYPPAQTHSLKILEAELCEAKIFSPR